MNDTRGSGHLSDSDALVVRHLYKVFGDNPEVAIDLDKEGLGKDEIFEKTGMTIGVCDASFTVRRGEIFVVMGLSGSGKSTLVRTINGLIPATRGQIIIDSTDVAAASEEELRRIRRGKVAMVFQHFALFPHKTVADNVAYGLKIKGVDTGERRKRAIDALAQVGLEAYADSYPDELSGGMQQRVGLARGLATEPEILLMDEPFSALDPLIRRDMQDELLDLQRSMNKTIVFITHDLNEALILGDQIAIMKDGRFVQVGTAEEIVASPADDYVAAFTQDIDRSRVFTAADVATAAEAVDLETADADTALGRMDDLGRDALYVTGKGGIAGVVTYRGLAAAEHGRNRLTTALITDFPAAAPATQLFELYPLAQRGLPIAIVDRNGGLDGVVSPQDVFAKLAGGTGRTGVAGGNPADDEPAAGRPAVAAASQ